MDACRFGILLGLRIEELCALRWENVSLRNKTIHVGATMQRLRDMDNTGEGKTKVIISTPKSSTSITLGRYVHSSMELKRANMGNWK